MSFHKRFIATSNAAALASIAAASDLPTAVKAYISEALHNLPGDGPVEVEAIGHLATPSTDARHRFSQASTITSLKVQPVVFVEPPAPEPAPGVSSVTQGQIDAAQGVNAETGNLTGAGQAD